MYPKGYSLNPPLRQHLLHLLAYPPAFAGFLDGFVLDKGGEGLALDKGQGRFVLLGQGSGQIPSNHHIDIIFVRLDIGYKGEHFALKVVI